jgi:cation diffusion facilitator family transporter
MAGCCNDKACDIEELRHRQSHTLKIVLVINALMFVVEAGAGILSQSISLIADSLDMLGDALVYAFSLYVVGRGPRLKAIAALTKAAAMAGFGIFVLSEAIYRILNPHLPDFATISGIGFLALIANTICLMLLWRHKSEDINMSSVWICSRNDIIANSSVILAGFAVWLSQTGWPDVLVGLALSVLFLRSAYTVSHEALVELKKLGASAQ